MSRAPFQLLQETPESPLNRLALAHYLKRSSLVPDQGYPNSSTLLEACLTHRRLLFASLCVENNHGRLIHPKYFFEQLIFDDYFPVYSRIRRFHIQDDLRFRWQRIWKVLLH